MANHHAAGAGAVPPTNDEGPTAATVAPNCPASADGNALRAIEGERSAGEYPARLRAHQAEPDALIVAPLYGAELRRCCRMPAKARGGAR